MIGFINFNAVYAQTTVLDEIFCFTLRLFSEELVEAEMRNVKQVARTRIKRKRNFFI